MTTEIDDLQLVWPANLFVAEAESLLSTGYANDQAAVSLLLREAFAQPTGEDLFHEVSQPSYKGQWKPGQLRLAGGLGVYIPESRAPYVEMAPVCRLLLEEVVTRVKRGEIPDHSAPSYWSHRQAGSPTAPPTPLSHPQLWRGFMDLLQELVDGDYLQPVASWSCEDEPDALSTPGRVQLTNLLRRPMDWPLDDPETVLTEPDLYDLLEAFHDLVARPRTSTWHASCRDYHYQEHDKRAGRRVYASKVNALLARSELRLRLSTEPADAGHLVEIAGDERDELEAASLQRAGESSQTRRAAHGVQLHRYRNATREDKRDAVRALADALEPQRAAIETHLSKGDAADLFFIINRFDIRHNNRSQQDDYPEEFLDYVYWTLLSTQELLNRLASKQ